MGIINNIISGILGSNDPNGTFMELINSNPELKKKYDEMNQYGNNNPKAAFINYTAAKGKQNIAQNIMRFFGLNF